MNFFKIMFHSYNLKNYISLFLLFFFLSNLFVSKANENTSLNISRTNKNKFNELFSHNHIKYKEHDNTENQLKMFFGFDPESPEISFYPDSLIINYSEYVRDIYKLKLNDLTMKK